MNVGDYVRTRSNGIQKIDEEGRIDLGLIKPHFSIIKKEVIIKSSPNIIDVLEEHDFVQMQDRGNRFYEIERDYTGKLSLRDIGWDEYEELDETNISEIVSIITHEQMEQMKYKVGD